MSHLASVYARDLGVKVGKPYFQPHFFPVQDKKYIVIHNGTKVPAKTYAYWTEVINLIKPILQKNDIKIYQIGLEEEGIINGINKRIFTSSLKQVAFVIKHSMLVAGIDSVPIHMASCLDVPSVSLYAHTYSNTCCPIWNQDSKAVVIESHRNDKKPSFSLDEHPKTVNFIYPERIAKAILESLGLFDPKETKLVKTIFIGDHYNSSTVDVVLPPLLLNPYLSPPNNSTIRVDLSYQPASLDKLLSQNDGTFIIKTNRPIDINILSKNKHKIKFLIYQASQFDEVFVNSLYKLGIEFSMVCDSPQSLKEQRFKFFENEIHYFNEDEFIATKANIIKSKVESGQISFTSKKIYYYGNNRILNFLELQKTIGRKPKKDSFFIDLDHMWIYTTEN